MYQVWLILKDFCLVGGLTSLPSPEKTVRREHFSRDITANYRQIIASGVLTRRLLAHLFGHKTSVTIYVSNIIWPSTSPKKHAIDSIEIPLLQVWHLPLPIPNQKSLKWCMHVLYFSVISQQQQHPPFFHVLSGFCHLFSERNLRHLRISPSQLQPPQEFFHRRVKQYIWSN